MKYIIKAYNILELGQRTNQEDSIFPALGEVRDSDRLFILCDGMGGHESGEVASSTVCGAMSRYILQNCPDPEGEFSDETFGRALAFALDELDKKDTGAKKKMGTTMTFLKLHDKGCTIAHIGDSRVYHIRPGQTLQETRILHQTGDHSLVNDLVKLGEITAEEAKYSKQKNVITRAMQPCMERRPRADIYHTHDIKAGDYFFMCSDGILEDWDDDNVKYTFCNKGGRNDNEKIEMLVKATSMHKDNHSAIIIHVMKVIDPLPVQKPQPVPYMAEIEDDKPVPKRIPTWKKLIAGFAIGIAIGGLIAYVVPKILSKNNEEISQTEGNNRQPKNYTDHGTDQDNPSNCGKIGKLDTLIKFLSDNTFQKVNKVNYDDFKNKYQRANEKFNTLKRRDITGNNKEKLKEAKQKLEEAKQKLKEFEDSIKNLANNVANSFNNIKSYQDTIKQDEIDSAKSKIGRAASLFNEYKNKAPESLFDKYNTNIDSNILKQAREKLENNSSKRITGENIQNSAKKQNT